MSEKRPDLAGHSIFAIQIRRWKRAMLEAYFSDARFTYLPLYLGGRDFLSVWSSALLQADRPALLVWGGDLPQEMATFAEANGIPVYFLEDGFIRSLVGSASKALPFSLTLDHRAAYFDARRPSDLEDLLATYDFDADPALRRRAEDGIAALLASRLSKYNGPRQDMDFQRPAQTRKRILVVGQVEDDASIRLGCDRPMTNNDLVRMAAAENPGCDILYKPHPDVLNGVRKRLSDPADVAHLATIIDGAVALPDLLETVDHVYTITSLAGFEALLRGIPVTVAGAPFYAGWGLTDDRQVNPRRGRRLALADVFAAAYLLYPRYFNPVDGSEISFEECLRLALLWRGTGMPQSRIVPHTMPAGPGWRAFGAYGVLGWRHLLTLPVGLIVRLVAGQGTACNYRRNPIAFFRELSEPQLRRLGRLLYPFD